MSAFVLSFDLEDWHQLVRRSVSAAGWDEPHPSFELRPASSSTSWTSSA